MICTFLKRVLHFLPFSSLILLLPAQSTVIIGSITDQTTLAPFHAQAKYSWSAAIYLQTEIQTEGLITNIAYNLANPISDFSLDNQKIYMEITEEIEYSSDTQPNTSNMMLVYDGSIHWQGSEWQTITLQTPFYYGNAQSANLCICWENHSGIATASGYPLFNCSNILLYHMVKFNYADDAFPGDGPGFYTTYYRPVLRLTMHSGLKHLEQVTVEQNTNPVAPGSNMQDIIKLKANVVGAEGTVLINGLQLGTAGTTNLNDIANLRVWYTGTDPSFTITTQFGPTFPNPEETATFTTTAQELTWGENYFWITYDIPATATVGNVVDAGCDFISHNDGILYLEAYPEGARKIANPIGGEVTIGDDGYASLAEIFDIINTIGLADNTNINIPDGVYTETAGLSLDGWAGDYGLSINGPPGAGEIATVTSEAAIVFDNVKGLTINGGHSLVFVNPSTDQPVIQLHNSKNTTIEGVKIVGNSTNWWETGNLGLLNVRSGSENTIISGCSFGGIPGAENIPGFAIAIGEVDDPLPITNTVIMHNDIHNFGEIGIYVGYDTYTTTVAGNFVSGTDGQSSFVGIDDVGQGTCIDGNFIYFPEILNDYGYYIGIDQNAVRKGQVYNNFIYGIFTATNEQHYIGGLTFSGNIPEFSTDVKHNTIYLIGHSSGGNAYIFDSNDPNGTLNFSNNIVSQQITGTSSIAAFHFEETIPAGFSMNNNNYTISQGAPFGYMPGFTTTVPVNTLDSWTATTGLDVNSTSGMVPFNQAGDPHITITQTIGKVQQDYTYLEVERDPAVLYDIDGEERPETTYKGADQPEVEIIPTAIMADHTKMVHTYQLYQNYPNPFNPVTTIRYDIPEKGDVKLEIYNLIGQCIKTIELGIKTNGSYRYFLDMGDHATGIYFYKLKTGKFEKTRKMLLVK